MLRNIRAAMDLIGDVSAYIGGPNSDRGLYKFLDVVTKKIWKEAVAKQPISREETWRRGSPTPSDRMNHTPIYQGWDTITQATSPGRLVSQISNRSPHLAPVIDGAIRHRIPKTGYARPLLTFYWEEPKGKHIDTGPGIRRFKWVDHPGQAPNRFFWDAVDMHRDDVRNAVIEGTKEFIRNAMEDAGLKEVTK